ncbi:hypothetical protein G6F63_013162 [Rhizopus arrhizus]|nr:hypothetical protein G6F63_013162 [Rhizopus arrhizus]
MTRSPTLLSSTLPCTLRLSCPPTDGAAGGGGDGLGPGAGALAGVVAGQRGLEITGDGFGVASGGNRLGFAGLVLLGHLAGHIGGAGAGDAERIGAGHGDAAVAADTDVLVGPDAHRVVDRHRGRLVVLDAGVLVVEHGGDHVALRAHVQQLATGTIVHGDLVPARALHRLRLQAADLHAERRHVVFVVDAAGDDRTVRITVEEVDDHFLAHARR